MVRQSTRAFSSSSIIRNGPKVTPADLTYHWDTTPATFNNLAEAESFFTKHKPSTLFIAGKLYQVKVTSVPEVAFFGRSNVGKSSLLNALMVTDLCRTSKNPGRTRTMNAYAVGGQDTQGNPGRINILDMPGYGHGSREEWGKQIQKYLEQRKELKRVFFMVDALHGLKSSDREFMQLLRHSSIPHQIILSKADRVVFGKGKKVTPEQLKSNIQDLKALFEKLKPEIQPKNDGPPALGELLACSTDMNKFKNNSTEPGRFMGINAIRRAILKATGLSNARSKNNPQLQVLPDELAGTDANKDN